MIADGSDKVLKAFEKYDLNKESLVKREQLARILNDLLLKHGQGKTETSKMPTQIEAELWDKTTGNQNGEVALADYVLTVVKAREMLLQKIQETEVKKKNVQAEIDQVCSLIVKAKRENQDQEAQRLMDVLRQLEVDSINCDESAQSYRENLKLLTITFDLDEQIKLDHNITPIDAAQGVTGEQEGTNKTVHNSSLQNIQNISVGNPLNISHNVNRSAGSHRSILDTSAQRIRNLSMMNARDLASLPPHPPIYVPPVHLLPVHDASALVAQEKVAISTAAYSPGHPETSILHRESPRPYEGVGHEYHSKKLSCIFWLNIALLLLELFQMLEKTSMLGLLFSLSVIGMFMLHRFSSSNVKYTIAFGLLSIVVDFVWMAVKLRTFLSRDCGWGCLFDVYRAHHKWPYETIHIKLHLAIVYVGLFSAFLKLVISLLLCRFRRQTEQDNEQSIRLFGHELIISDEAYAANPHGYGYSPQQTYLA